MNRERLFARLGQTPYKALIDATALGRSARHSFVDLDHWALCMLRREDSDLCRMLLDLNSDIPSVQSRLEGALARIGQSGESLRDISPSLERCVAPALSWSQISAPARHIRSYHVVLTWLDEESTCRWLQRLDPRGLGALTVESFLERFEARCIHWPEAREHAGTDSGFAESMAVDALSGGAAASGAGAAAGDGTLARWATCLSEQAEKNELDPVVGRNDELRAVIDILLRRRQNNPILVGEAGVGKTSVVEALAQRIHKGEVPAGLQSARVWALDIARLQAGASARGEFEQRLRSVIDAVIASEHPIILFCDEAHTLIGAGGAAGTGDAVNLIKPMLARGQLRMIAATTWSEYKQFIEPDAALTRRFQTVAVVEPDIRVHFHWDRYKTTEEDCSCWIRVSQAWAGKGWGVIAMPRVGQEVLVTYVDGDLDRPLVTGIVYNGDNPTPYDLPKDIRYTGIVSRSLKHGEVQHASQITFDDQRGAERVMVHAQQDLQHTVERNHATAVGKDMHTQIKDTCTSTTDKRIKYQNHCMTYSGTKIDYACVRVNFRGHCLQSHGVHTQHHACHTEHHGTHTAHTDCKTITINNYIETKATSNAYVAFSFSCTGISISKTGISLSCTGISKSVRGIADSITGLSCSLTGLSFSITGVSISHTFKTIALKDLTMKKVGMKILC